MKMPPDSSIAGVSDTALWIAAVRADEAARPDAVFLDPLAAVLAGERGRSIARSMPRRSMVAWGVVARTCAIDRLLDEALGTGIDTVINLGAGLDTRPYRLPLPAELRWIEVDFPPLIDFKAGLLDGHRPVCRLERIGLDLLDDAARSRFLSRMAQTSRSALVITEGVLAYLSNEAVALLAKDLCTVPALRYWIQEFDNAGKRGLPRGWQNKLKAAPMLFEPPDWFEFFRECGWSPSRVITSIEQSERITRPYPWDLPYGLLMRALPANVKRRILSLSGAVMWRKS